MAWLMHHHADFKSPFSRMEEKNRGKSTASTSKRDRKHYNFQPFCTRVTITSRAFFAPNQTQTDFSLPRKLLSWKVMVMVKWEEMEHNLPCGVSAYSMYGIGIQYTINRIYYVLYRYMFRD